MWCENMAVNETELEFKEGKHLNGDDSEFHHSEGLVQVGGCGSNVLPPCSTSHTAGTNDQVADNDTNKTSFSGSSNAVFDRFEAELQNKQPQVEVEPRSMTKITDSSTNSRPWQQTRVRISSFQENSANDVDTFEEAFSKHRYAGSFRLRFCRDEFVSRESKTHVQAIDTTESATLVLHDEIDTQELFEQTTSPSKQIKVKSDTDHSKPSSEIAEYVIEKRSIDVETIELNDAGVQEDNNMVGRDSATTIDSNEEDDSFHFYPPGKEPVLHPTFKQRAEKVVSSIIQTNSNTSKLSCCSCAQDCTNCCSPGLMFECCATSCSTTNIPCRFPHFSIELKAASRQGTRMLRSFLFPTMPKLLTDSWVLIELGVTLAQFILSVVSIMIDSNRVFNIIYLVLASVALVLALVDAFIYFKDFGTCSHHFHHCCSRLSPLKYRSRVKERHVQQCTLGMHSFSNNSFLDLDIDSIEQIGAVTNIMRRANHGCCHLGDRSRLKTIMSESFELVRTILSELLIYPLLMFDLLDVIVGGSYQLTNTVDRLNLSLFIIGSVFLILSVYVSRAFMVISMTIQLRRMPIDPSKSKTSILGVVTEFCVYVLFQISVHIAVIMAVGAKLYQENPTPCQDLQTLCKQVSPSLIYVMVCGGILPFYGMLVFFILNYFQLREISVGFWTNMVSLLHSENFSNLIFSTKGIEESKMKAKELINSVHLHQVKSQLTTILSTPSWVKILYPLKFPFFIPILFLYVVMLFSFIAALAFTYEEDTGFDFTLFDNNFSPAFFILAIIVLAANLHAITLVLAAMLAAIVIILTTALQPLFCVLVAFAYVPVGGCLSFLSLVSSRMNSNS